MDKRKLKLKNYRLKSLSPVCPVNGEIELKTQSVTEYFEANIEDSPEMVIEVALEKKDVLNAILLVVYTNPATIIFTLLGLLIFISGITNSDSVINIKTILGAFLVFFLPATLLININRTYDSDIALKETSKYSFYKHYYIVDYFGGSSRVDCVNLVKIDEINPSFLLYTTPKFFHMIPKRVFDGKEDELEKFRQIINEYRIHKSQSKINKI